MEEDIQGGMDNGHTKGESHTGEMDRQRGYISSHRNLKVSMVVV